MLHTDLVEYFRQNAKPRAEWRVGVEVELFGFDKATKQRLDNLQVQAVLRGLARTPDDAVVEDGLTVETRAANGGKWTVEPGGQIEFAGAPQEDLMAVERELADNFADLRRVGEALGFEFLAIGFDPLRTIDEQKWFLKPRYKLMKPYMAERGRRAWDMMTRTASVQINVDYADERDLIKKFVVGNRLAPTVAAIFANAPFADGKLSGYKSIRVETWNETDAHRCSVSPLAARDEFTLEDFVEYALDVPMLFLRKDGEYLENFTGKKFREFLANEEITATLTDFQNHLTTIFTDARLKNYIELRSADCGDLSQTMAVAALWKGLLYDDAALQRAFKLAPKMNAENYCAMQQAVAQNGLQAIFGGVRVLDLAKEIVTIAADGLNRTAPGEAKYLNVLRQRVGSDEKAPADILLEKWGGSIERVFELTAL